MTTRYLSGAYPGGYTLNSNYSGLVIESTASVGGTGVVATSNVSIRNDGLVRASNTSSGILLHAGGTVINGSAADTTALISGEEDGVRGVGGHSATIANYGTIAGYGRGHAGVDLFRGGLVTNGSSDDTTALIGGYFGVSLQDVAAAVVNFGTIRAGILLEAGGTVTNGSISDTVALIGSVSPDRFAVNASKVAATVVNFGTVDGVFLNDGAVINGSATDTAALIASDFAVLFSGSGTVTNFGTIVGDIAFTGNGTVTNGTNDDTGALMSSEVFTTAGALAITNFGTISSARDFAVGLEEGGVLINGSATDTTAMVTGVYGVDGASSQATVTNFGTIVGTGGKAVQFYTANCVLNVEAGCAFVGRVWGDGGTLDLASGVGVVSGLSDGNLNVLGSMARTHFTYFGTLEIASGAQFALTGHGAIASGGIQTLIDDGLFMVREDLTVSGTVAGTGTLAMQAGATIEIDTAAPSSLTVAFKGHDATLALSSPSSLAATISGLAVTDTIDLLGIQATSAQVDSKDMLVIYDGSSTVADLQLKGNYKSATFDLSSDGDGGTKVTLLTTGGAPPQAIASPHLLIAAAAWMGAGAGSSHAISGAAHEDWRPTLLAARMQAA